jgi:hypothetical protein
MKYEVGTDWTRFVPAIYWELETAKQRKENPQSILDVMHSGDDPNAVVGWSEIYARFEDLMTDDPVRDRLEYDEARKYVIKKKKMQQFM